MYRNLLIIILLLINSINIFGSPSLKIKTDVPNNKIEIGQTFHMIIEAKDCPGEELKINKVPSGIKVVYRTVDLDPMTGTISLIWTCKAIEKGSFSYGPVNIGNVSSNKITYQILPQQQQSKSPANQATQNSQYDPNAGPMFIGKGNEEMFLRASVNKITAFEQEAIEYTVKLYTSYNVIKFLGATAAPKFDGFVVEEAKVGTVSPSSETLNGKVFKTAVIAKYIIFPQKSGKLKIKGNTYTVSTDAEEYYHDSDPFFGMMTVRRPVQLNITPNDLELEIKPLPLPIPDNFIGGVGKFELNTQKPSTELAANSATSLIFTFSGSGNIKYLKMPSLNNLFPSSIELFSPETSINSEVEGSTVKGVAKFDYSLIPRQVGMFNIPKLTFTYFDPETAEYKTLETNPFTLNVEQGKSSEKSQQALKFNQELLPTGKLMKEVEYPYVLKFPYWLWFIVPAIGFILGVGFYMRYQKTHEDLVALRSKRANKMALRRLSKAYKCYKARDKEAFYDEMLTALWGYIGDKLKMPTSALTRANVGEEFEKHGVKEETFKPIIQLIDECEFAKYSSSKDEDNDMKQIYEQAVKSISMVEKEYSEILVSDEIQEEAY